MPRPHVIALMLGIAACGGSSASGRGGDPPLRIVANDFAFGKTFDSVQAGWHWFRVVNAGKQIHMAVVARVDSGKSLDDVIAGVKARSKMPWLVEVGGVNAVFPGDSLETAVKLDRGRYVLLCYVPDSTGKYHLFDGMVSTFVAGNGGVAAIAEPAADDTVQLASFVIGFMSPPRRGTHVYRVENADPAPVGHDLVIVRLSNGKTAADVIAWLATLTGPAPFTVVGATTGMEAGMHDYLHVDLAPGSYFAFCMMSAPDGQRHFALGMQTTFDVGE